MNEILKPILTNPTFILARQLCVLFFVVLYDRAHLLDVARRGPPRRDAVVLGARGHVLHRRRAGSSTSSCARRSTSTTCASASSRSGAKEVALQTTGGDVRRVPEAGGDGLPHLPVLHEEAQEAVRRVRARAEDELERVPVLQDEAGVADDVPDISVKLPDGSTKSGPRRLDRPRRRRRRSVRGSPPPPSSASSTARLVDLDTVVARRRRRVEIVTESQPEALDVLRHSAAHVMAEAVKDLFPTARSSPSARRSRTASTTTSTSTARSRPRTSRAIETRMREIVAEALPFERGELDRLEALDAFEGQPYKQELIAELPEDETISIYTQGNFTDLCRGPHVPDTSRLKAFTLHEGRRRVLARRQRPPDAAAHLRHRLVLAEGPRRRT